MNKGYDAVIIGFGKGGKTLAGKLAASGKRVAVVERSPKMYGGTCINVGCIPSKSLIHSAAASARRAASFEEKAARYAGAVAEKRRLTSLLRDKNYQKLIDAGVEVLDGEASFRSPREVEVRLTGAGETAVLTGKEIFINTGSIPVLPPIPGLGESSRVYTSETLMELETLPRRLAVIGGGYIGLEFASLYTNFGSRVTVLEGGETFLPREDRDMAAAIRETLEGRGVNFLLGAAVKGVEDLGDSVRLRFDRLGDSHTLDADAVLAAVGRRPNTDGLNLAAAGVETTPRGAVRVDAALRTSVPHIWAMGDVNGGPQFTYISLDDFRVVWGQLNGGEYTTDRRSSVPNSVFLDPPFSRVGLTEAEARAAGKDFRVAKLPAAAIPKAQVLGSAQGLLKALVENGTGRILGAALFCEESHELINTVKLAMDLGADSAVLRDRIYTHPTMSEALNDLFA